MTRKVVTDLDVRGALTVGGLPISSGGGGGGGVVYVADLGAVTAYAPVTVTHGLGTLDLFVQVIEKNSAAAGAGAGEFTFPTIDVVTTSTITLTFAESKAANLYRVIVSPGGGGGGGSGGSTILSGTTAPTGGAVGDYYLDTDDRVLYGPKIAGEGPGSIPARANVYLSKTDGNGLWSSPANAADGAYGSTGTSAEHLTNTANDVGTITVGFGSQFASVPAVATNISLSVTIRTVVSNLTRMSAITFQPFDNTTPIGSPASAVISLSSRTDTAAFALTLAQAQSNNLKVVVTATRSAEGSNNTFYLDNVDAILSYDTPAWPVALKSVPSGGTASQVLTKSTFNDFDASWQTGGGGGGASTLDDLTDVSAPSSTPVGKILGTTATGTWGPIDSSVGAPIVSPTAPASPAYGQIWIQYP